jgi:predicted transcriptional regulator
MSVTTKAIKADIPLSLADRLDSIAARLVRSPDWVLQQALTAWVDREDAAHQLTLQALDDVDQGSLLEAAAVQAWANSLTTGKPLLPGTA